MPYLRHYRLQFGGSLFGTEQWSCSLHMIPGVDTLLEGPFIDFADAALDDVASDVLAWYKRSASLFSAASRLDYVKFNAIGPDGKYLDQTTTRATTFNSTPQTPPAGAGVGVPQVALALSMRTERKRGPGSHGRVFIPVANVPLDASDPHIPSGTANLAADSFRILINDLNNWPGIDAPMDPNVGLVSPLGAGHRVLVTGVAVGNVLDTQQRRRNQISEAYSVLAL